MAIERKTYTIDASGKILGRLAVETANLLRGRKKPSFMPYLDQGDEVVIFNTDEVQVSGKKAKQKMYYDHSLYPGGLKKNRLEELMEKDSREVIRRAVYGMLPANRLRAKMMVRLKLFKKGTK